MLCNDLMSGYILFLFQRTERGLLINISTHPPLHLSNSFIWPILPIHLFASKAPHLSTYPPNSTYTLILSTYPSTKPPMCQSTYPPIYQSTSSPLHLCTCPPIHQYVNPPVPLFPCTYAHLSTYPPIQLSIYLPVHLSTDLPIHICTYPAIQLFTHLPIHLSICQLIALLP